MPIDVVPVPYGPGAHDELARCVRAAKAGDALRPVTVVVPSNYVGVAARRRLATGDGLVAVTFVTAYRLGELLGAAALAAEGRRPVSNPVLLAAVQEQLRLDPGVFEPVWEHPATEEALVAAHKQLADLSAEALGRLGASSSQARDVVRLHRAVKQRLAPDWFDEADLLDTAADELERGHPVAAGLGQVLVFLPQQLGRRAARLLASAARRVPVTVLVGLTGSADADQAVLRSLDWLGAPPPAARHEPAPSIPALRVITTSDADEEIRAAVRVVVDAARAGTSLERIAIVHPADDHYASLVHQHLDAASIPCNGAAPDHLADRVAGRTLLHVLTLAGRPPHRDEVFRILAGAPVRTAAGRPVPAVAWERLSRDAGVVGTSRTEWHDRLTSYAAGRQEEARAKEADDLEAHARRLRREAEQALALRDFVLDLLDRLGALQSAGTWRELARGSAELLAHLVGREQRRSGWPRVERDAAEQVERALERLAHLDAVASGSDLTRFERALALELDADLGRRGRFGDGVLVGRVGLAVGLELDLVVVVGLAEGVLPSRQHDDALLPDRDRSAVADELPPAAERQRREHRELLAAVAAASVEVVLTVPRGDLRRTTQHVASRWLLDLVELHHGVRLWSDELLHHRAPWLHHVGSFAAGIREAGRPATEQEALVRTVLAGRPLVGDVAFELGQRMVNGRAGPAFGPYDGNLAGSTVVSPAAAGQVVSPTRLEAWAACPYAYFVRYLLGVEPVDNPEEVLFLSALEEGKLVHQAMEGYVATRIAEGSAAGPTDVDLLRRHFELACREVEARGVTGRPLLWRHRREQLWHDLTVFAEADAQRCQRDRAEPLAAELRFGFDGEPVPVVLDGERVLHFRGSADRVDRAGDDGHLVVTDYKYASARKFVDLSDTNPTANGTLLQLPIYALAARAQYGGDQLPLPVVARYAFAKPDRNTGKRPADRALTVDDATLAHWRDALAVIVDGIEHGWFPARPGDDGALFANFIACPACDPDGLGTAELQRRWAQVRSAPELDGYVTLLGLAPGDEIDDG